jgi:uncharacterized protein
MLVQTARETLAKLGIQVDVQDTVYSLFLRLMQKNAASMFNLLQAEGRSVAAALLVQESIDSMKK